MSAYLYAPITYVYSAYGWFNEWLTTYVYYKKRQPPKITYIRCFRCHSEDVMNKGGSPDDIKSKYCRECYNKLLQEAMDNLITNLR